MTHTDSPAHLPDGCSFEAPLKAADLSNLCSHLEAHGARVLAACPDAQIEHAWQETWTELTNPHHPVRSRLIERTCEISGAHPNTLAAGLDVMLSGSSPEVLSRLMARAAPPVTRAPFLVNLAATPFGLAVQSLLPALATKRPLILRSSGREPWFACTAVERLAFHLPVLKEALAAVTWPSAREDLANAAAAGVARVIAYGGQQAIAQWSSRHPGFVGFGPRVSIGIVLGSANEDPEVARGLARDIALFDQGGCLSLQWIASDRPKVLAPLLESALGDAAEQLPPRALELAEASKARVEVSAAALAGDVVSWAVPGTLGHGTVIETRGQGAARPSPGARVVRLVGVSADFESVGRAVATWGLHIQGAVVLADSRKLASRIEALLQGMGTSHIATPGCLQAVDASWKNGGLDPLELYASDPQQPARG